MQFYGKLTSNQIIGRETMQFLWEINLKTKLTKKYPQEYCYFI